MKQFFILLILFFIFDSALSQKEKMLKIGDQYEGGIVFYLDASNDHGLIAAPYDQTTKKIMWGPNGNTNALSPTDGQSNTKKIIEYFKNHYRGVEKTAANICDTLTLNGFSDWYLPAIDELRYMYNERLSIGNFLIGDYCSSTEFRKDDAYSIHFRPCKRVDFYYNKDNRDYYVRCIRKF